MLDRVAVLSAAPIAAFLTLLLQLLLSFGVGETKAEFDVVMFDEVAVVFADDTLSNLTGFESASLSWVY